ncbi:PEP-utilizing enzyme [bacterium]|nr:PEP-utilizing enzyme [bacterium]MDB4792480.1 PEP-utilizing enzyme [bacterium]
MNARILAPLQCTPGDPIGGKAGALAKLTLSGFEIPAWFVVTEGKINNEALSNSLATLGDGPFAVRSSALAEDGEEHSFAGQFDSFLNVPTEQVESRIHDVRKSQQSERIDSYTENQKIQHSHGIAVIVQAMIPAKSAGVAFNADPITGQRSVSLVSAIKGLGEDLVSGEVDCDTWRVDRSNEIISKVMILHSLSDSEVLRVVSLCRECSKHFGSPQDIEWAFDPDGKLWLLQSRPITTLGKLPDPDDELTVWDNSNIAESYGGVTTPLTFTFATRVYEHVYREFCKLLGVPKSRISSNDHVFPKMLGLVHGRVYYNLTSWYRVLALLPGFQVNRSFMEQMMGVKQALPDEIVDGIIAENQGSKWQDSFDLLKTTFGLVRSYWKLPRQIRKFYSRLDQSLKLESPLTDMRGEELVNHYRDLESQLLNKWDAPLVNDFFAMIFYGVLSKVCTKWLDDENGTLQNELLLNSGDIISARPPRLIKEMAEVVRPDKALGQLLADPDLPNLQKLAKIKKLPKLFDKFEAYLEEFGDRCLEELKLESPTLVDDPGPLLMSIGSFALQAPKETATHTEPEYHLSNPVKKLLFKWILSQTRKRVRDRENLRFERTRVFGRVRKIVRQVGERLTADGQIDAAGDVFHLRLDEVLSSYSLTSITADLNGLAKVRKEEFREYHKSQPPPDRFQTRGSLHRQREFADDSGAPEGEADMQGIGACAGIVKGPVRVVTNPREARLQPGEILVATQTDPGWVVLFPAASGLLVERGSLLSHSAIVARELQLPCIVSLSNITRTLKTGDIVEMNGKTGAVTLIDHE